jgi:hypothetical protein
LLFCCLKTELIRIMMWVYEAKKLRIN